VAAIEEAAETASEAASSRERPHTGSGIWLNTPQWLLMNVTPAHASLFARLHARNGDHFRLAMTLEPAMTEAAFWEPHLAQQQRAFFDGTGLYLVGFHKRATQPEIGCVISFSGIVHDEFQTCWLGYRIDRSLEGRGLMHAALAPAIAAVFERYKLHRIMASHQPENLRSARVLRRLGFGIEGYSRDFMRVNGEWRDNVLVALLAPG
jgi:ribosomal-protein-alanine N-acetyltransferase